MVDMKALKMAAQKAVLKVPKMVDEMVVLSVVERVRSSLTH